MSEEVNRPRGEFDHENEVKQPGVKEKGGESAGYHYGTEYVDNLSSLESLGAEKCFSRVGTCLRIFW